MCGLTPRVDRNDLEDIEKVFVTDGPVVGVKTQGPQLVEQLVRTHRRILRPSGSQRAARSAHNSKGQNAWSGGTPEARPSMRRSAHGNRGSHADRERRARALAEPAQ